MNGRLGGVGGGICVAPSEYITIAATHETMTRAYNIIMILLFFYE